MADLPILLAPLGIRLVTAPPADSALRDRLAQHLLMQNCGPGAHGFLRHSQGIRLQASAPACGPLAADQLITRIEEQDLMQAALGAFQAATARCAAGQPLRLEGPEGEWSVPCPRPLPPAPPRFQPALVSGG